MPRSESETVGRPDWVLLGATLALVAIGLLMVYSSTADLALRGNKESGYYFQQQAKWLSLGLLALIVVTWLPHRFWMKISIPLMAFTVLLLAFVAIFRDSRHLLGNSVSPVEPAKLAVVVYIGHWLSSKGDLVRRLPYGLLPFTIIVGLVAGLVMVQEDPDLSEAMVIILVAMAMFFLSGADLIQFAIGVMGGSAAFILVITQVPEALKRLRMFVQAWKDPFSSANIQMMRGLEALGSGGLFGLGPGAGRMKFFWLPNAHTDSIFAILGEEFGLIGSLAVLALFAVLVYRGFRIASQAVDPFGRLLASGITCWIGTQALVNLAVVTNTIPFTGIALPFISVGGSSLGTCLAGVGLLLSISRVSSVEVSGFDARRLANNQYQPSEVGRRVLP